MTQFTRNGRMVCIGDRLRIEPGPALVTAKATEELLGAETADHYHAPREHEDGNTVHARDAMGDKIEVGKDMTYLDWVGFSAPEPREVFYLYKLEDRTAEEAEHSEEPTIWREAGTYDTEEQAITAALSMEG